MGHCSWAVDCHVFVCLGLGDLFSFGGLSKKSVMSTMLSSMSGSKSSNVLVFLA